MELTNIAESSQHCQLCGDYWAEMADGRGKVWRTGCINPQCENFVDDSEKLRKERAAKEYYA